MQDADDIDTKKIENATGPVNNDSVVHEPADEKPKKPILRPKGKKNASKPNPKTIAKNVRVVEHNELKLRPKTDEAEFEGKFIKK